tara:strand:+ start:164531 stop:164767 length:237 start_codon:yes stop_codon:yes gene_type:complete
VSVILRLTRRGAKKKPFYRIVATDSRKARDGKFLETLGRYNPHLSENQVSYKKERVDYWLSEGATVSDTVKSILKKGL